MHSLYIRRRIRKTLMQHMIFYLTHIEHNPQLIARICWVLWFLTFSLCTTDFNFTNGLCFISRTACSSFSFFVACEHFLTFISWLALFILLWWLHYVCCLFVLFGLRIYPGTWFEIHHAKLINVLWAIQPPCVLQTQTSFWNFDANEDRGLRNITIQKTLK